MILRKIESWYTECTIDELSDDIKHLILKSKEATSLSYAPYSKFKVGCAILMENNHIVLGANQENASYPVCVCAEQVTLSKAATSHPDINISAIAISVDAPLFSDPIPPCGMCRQSILEYQNRMQRTFDIYLVGKEVIHKIEGIENILPLAFSSIHT
jgi:cytidine deaminase